MRPCHRAQPHDRPGRFLPAAAAVLWTACACLPAHGETTVETSHTPLLMVFVEGGSFDMGEKYDGRERVWNRPLHRVTVSSFLIGKYEVTQGQWAELMPTNPSLAKDPQLPVSNVTWQEAAEFCNRLSRREGLTPFYTLTTGENAQENWPAEGYRLPTEAEWEYAAGGGLLSRGTPYSGGDRPYDVAWYQRNTNRGPEPVGQKRVNEIGLYDMSGNVAEWCNDWYDHRYYYSSEAVDPRGPLYLGRRVLRGGSWNDEPEALRVVIRGSGEGRPGRAGLRVARSGARSAPPRADSFGTITVEVQAAGSVFVDGVDRGTVGPPRPTTLVGIATGSRIVEVRYTDGQCERGELSVGEEVPGQIAFDHIPQVPKPLPPDIADSIGMQTKAGSVLGMLDYYGKNLDRGLSQGERSALNLDSSYYLGVNESSDFSRLFDPEGVLGGMHIANAAKLAVSDRVLLGEFLLVAFSSGYGGAFFGLTADFANLLKLKAGYLLEGLASDHGGLYVGAELGPLVERLALDLVSRIVSQNELFFSFRQFDMGFAAIGLTASHVYVAPSQHYGGLSLRTSLRGGSVALSVDGRLRVITGGEVALDRSSVAVRVGRTFDLRSGDGVYGSIGAEIQNTTTGDLVLCPGARLMYVSKPDDRGEGLDKLRLHLGLQLRYDYPQGLFSVESPDRFGIVVVDYGFLY